MFSGPVYREGDFVIVLRDTRHGINHNLSYDREGRVITVIDGQGEGPNLYVVKLLHKRGGLKVDELCQSYIFS